MAPAAAASPWQSRPSRSAATDSPGKTAGSGTGAREPGAVAGEVFGGHFGGTGAERPGSSLRGPGGRAGADDREDRGRGGARATLSRVRAGRGDPGAAAGQSVCPRPGQGLEEVSGPAVPPAPWPMPEGGREKHGAERRGCPERALA